MGWGGGNFRLARICFSIPTWCITCPCTNIFFEFFALHELNFFPIPPHHFSNGRPLTIFGKYGSTFLVFFPGCLSSPKKPRNCHSENISYKLATILFVISMHCGSQLKKHRAPARIQTRHIQLICQKNAAKIINTEFRERPFADQLWRCCRQVITPN